MSLEHAPRRQRKEANGALWSLLTDRQLAALLSTSRATVWRRVADGSLPKPIKIGNATRWVQAEIEAAIDEAISKRDAGVAK